MGKVEIREVQRFSSKWILLFLFALLGVFVWAIVQQVVFDVPFGNNPTSNSVLFLFCLIPLGLFALFFIAKLETIITKDGISYQFKPFHSKKRLVKWSDIEEVKVIDYKPLLEYGGWGLRYGFKGKVFSVSGKKGLELKIKNKTKTILIGTQKGQEIELFLQNNQFIKN